MAAALTCVAGASAQTQEEIENAYPGYKLVFHDEFDKGDKPNPEVWQHEIGFCRNHEDQYYQEENSAIRDGNLVITAKKERVKNAAYKRYSSDWKQKNQYAEYTSASIWAKPAYQFHGGIWEIRAKIPVGTGYWPAIWSTGSKYEWPYNGEIDMMEYYGDAIHANVAWGSKTRWNATWSSQAPKMATFEKDFADKYHIWLMEWDDEAIRIYLDGRLLNETKLDRTVNPNPGEDWYNVDGYNPYRDPQNLQRMWLNLALGGDNGGSLQNTKFPAEYLVDYVRIYQPDGISSGLMRLAAKAEDLLNSTVEGPDPGQYSAQARTALSTAIAQARTKRDSKDQAEVDAAMAELNKAIDAFNKAANPCQVNVAYRFFHKESKMMLSAGWQEDRQQVLLLGDNRVEGADSKDYDQVVTLLTPPAGAKAKGFNMKLGDKYVYRDSWNIFWTDTPDLTKADYIFDVEFYGPNAVIKNFGTNKYIGCDDSAAWCPVYSDKAGDGNPKAYFEVWPADKSGIAAVFDCTEEITAVYSLEGVRLASSCEEFNRLGSGLYIVARGNAYEKVIK